MPGRISQAERQENFIYTFFLFDYLVALIINRYTVRSTIIPELPYAVDRNCFLSPFLFTQSGFIKSPMEVGILKLKLICKTTNELQNFVCWGKQIPQYFNFEHLKQSKTKKLSDQEGPAASSLFFFVLFFYFIFVPLSKVSIYRNSRKFLFVSSPKFSSPVFSHARQKLVIGKQRLQCRRTHTSFSNAKRVIKRQDWYAGNPKITRRNKRRPKNINAVAESVQIVLPTNGSSPAVIYCCSVEVSVSPLTRFLGHFTSLNLLLLFGLGDVQVRQPESDRDGPPSDSPS